MNLTMPLLLVAAASLVAAETKLTLLHMNDHHSHLTEDSAGYVNLYGDNIPSSVSANNGNTEYIRAYFGGFPRLVTAFRELEEEAAVKGRDVLKIHAGDAITGTSFYTLFKGDADAKLMNHMCFDVFVPGNHEFDYGDAGLARFLTSLQREANETAMCEDMPMVLGANIVPHDDSPLYSPDVPPIMRNGVFDTSDGEKVGVIGINDMRKTMGSSQPDKGTIILDEIETTKAQVESLTAMGVNKIIVVTHIGFKHDQEWIAALDGVDVIVGSHSHSLLGNDETWPVATPQGSYATVIEKPDGSKVCIVQAWEYSKAIGNLEIDFDDRGNVVSCGGSPIFPFNSDRVTVRDTDPWYDMSAEDAAIVIASLAERTGGQARAFAQDPDAVADLEDYSLQLDELTKEVVGFVPEFIGADGAGFERGACDLVAQAFLLHPLSTADVAIQNRGGCSGSIEAGDFTINDAYTLLPYSNTMVNIAMTGEEIKNVLEDAIDFYLDPKGAWGAYPRASGLRFNVNEGQKKGYRITNLEVNPKLASDSWVLIDKSASYIVVTNSYIASARDGYNGFGSVDDDLKVDTYLEYAQCFIDYAESVDSLDPVSADRASTQNWFAAAEDHGECHCMDGDFIHCDDPSKEAQCHCHSGMLHCEHVEDDYDEEQEEMSESSASGVPLLLHRGTILAAVTLGAALIL